MSLATLPPMPPVPSPLPTWLLADEWPDPTPCTPEFAVQLISHLPSPSSHLPPAISHPPNPIRQTLFIRSNPPDAPLPRFLVAQAVTEADFRAAASAAAPALASLRAPRSPLRAHGAFFVFCTAPATLFLVDRASPVLALEAPHWLCPPADRDPRMIASAAKYWHDYQRRLPK